MNSVYTLILIGSGYFSLIDQVAQKGNNFFFGYIFGRKVWKVIDKFFKQIGINIQRVFAVTQFFQFFGIACRAAEVIC